MFKSRLYHPLPFPRWYRIPELPGRAVSIGKGFIAPFLIPLVPLVKRTAIDVQLQKRLLYTHRGFFNYPDDLHLF
jgi:hypothetical protein